MVRRTIRPFTVEVRGSRRKADVPMLASDEQPYVSWPDALLKALNEDPAPAAPQTVAEKPQGRILPALIEPEPARVVPDEPPAAPFEMENRDEPVVLGQEVEDQPDVQVAVERRDEGVRLRRPRNARSMFARGERWKARLPVAIQGVRRKPRGRATE